jgi:hypothetical protein
MSELIKVGEIFVVQQDKKLIGAEIGFTDNVRNRQGAATTLDLVRGAMNNSGWIAQTILRVEDQQDAQTDTQAEGDSGEDNQTPPKPAAKQKKKAKASG